MRSTTKGRKSHSCHLSESVASPGAPLTIRTSVALDQRIEAYRRRLERLELRRISRVDSARRLIILGIKALGDELDEFDPGEVESIEKKRAERKITAPSAGANNLRGKGNEL